MCGTEEWEKYLDIKEGSGLKLNEDSPKICVDRGFRDRLSYEGDSDTQEGMLLAPRTAWGWQETEVGKDCFLIAAIRWRTEYPTRTYDQESNCRFPRLAQQPCVWEAIHIR